MDRPTDFDDLKDFILNSAQPPNFTRRKASLRSERQTILAGGIIIPCPTAPPLVLLTSPLSSDRQDANGSDVSEHGTELPAG